MLHSTIKEHRKNISPQYDFKSGSQVKVITTRPSDGSVLRLPETYLRHIEKANSFHLNSQDIPLLLQRTRFFPSTLHRRYFFLTTKNKSLVYLLFKRNADNL